MVRRTHPDGIQHQFWEDSYDSQFHADGRLLDPEVPYAPVAVQAYAYDALMLVARLHQDDAQRAHWMAIASRLQRRVLEEFWISDLETFAPAVVMNDSGPVPLRVVASSAGHLLPGRLLDGEDAAPYRNALVKRLLATDMLAPAGVHEIGDQRPLRAGVVPQRFRMACGHGSHRRGAASARLPQRGRRP
jgi:glycogen debranching enzyme